MKDYGSAEKHVVHDLEIYPNFFCGWFIQPVLGYTNYFEISPRRNDVAALVAFICSLRDHGYSLVGFNSLGFDYEIIHFIVQTYLATGRCHEQDIYARSQRIFAQQNTERFPDTVAEWNRILPQIDLFKIWHFDNKSKSTSLKSLQFNMRSESLEDLPIPPGTVLTQSQMEDVKNYGFHDTSETVKFYWQSREMIEMREALGKQFNKNFLNHNDTKIGKDFFITRIEEVAPGSCYIPGTRKARQTQRPGGVPLSDVIFPYVQFLEGSDFNRIKDFFARSVVTDPKGFFKDDADEDKKIAAHVGGLKFVFGSGGIHASVEKKTYDARPDRVIFDIDVSSYYPWLAIANRLFPEHLGAIFCDIYLALSKERKLHKKGSVLNAILKLALNGVYGESGNKYGSFFDLKYLLSITINGQLLLCMLAEQLLFIRTLEIIQVNTDGITVYVDPSELPKVREIMKWWMSFTKLELEEAFYSKMCIRDVNNYFALKTDGKIAKRKGAYSWERGQNIGVGQLAWHMDHSALIVPMAAEEHILRGTDIATFIHNHKDIFDFCIRAKVPRSTVLMLHDGEVLQNTIRYYVSTDGQGLKKIMPLTEGCIPGQFKRGKGVPDYIYQQVMQEIGLGVWDARIHTKNKKVYEDNREQNIEAGYTVTIANQIKTARFSNINYNYYIAAAKKLVAGVSG